MEANPRGAPCNVLAFVHTKEDGDREFSFYRNPGADQMLSENNLEEARIRNCRIFHFGSLSMTLETCRKATIRAIELEKESGAVISFDPNFTSKKYSCVIGCFAEQQGLSLDAALDFFITLRSIS